MKNLFITLLLLFIPICYSQGPSIPGFNLISTVGFYCLGNQMPNIAGSLHECLTECNMNTCNYLSWNGAICHLYKDCIPDMDINESTRYLYQRQSICEADLDVIGNMNLEISPESTIIMDTLYLYMAIPEMFTVHLLEFVNASEDCATYTDNRNALSCKELFWKERKMGCILYLYGVFPIPTIWNPDRGLNLLGFRMYWNKENQEIVSNIKTRFTQEVEYKDDSIDRVIEIWMPFYIILPHEVAVNIDFTMLQYIEPTMEPTFPGETLPPSTSPTTSQPSFRPTKTGETTTPPPTKHTTTTPEGQTFIPTRAPTTTGYTYPPSTSVVTTRRPTTTGYTYPPTSVITTKKPTTTGYTYPPTAQTTLRPTKEPTEVGETYRPSAFPTKIPSRDPTTTGYTYPPTEHTTTKPPTQSGYTYPPTSQPTLMPSKSPTKQGETYRPSKSPSIAPTTVGYTYPPTTGQEGKNICIRPNSRGKRCSDGYECSSDDRCRNSHCIGITTEFQLIDKVNVYYKLKETHFNSTTSYIKLELISLVSFPWKFITHEAINVVSPGLKISNFNFHIIADCPLVDCQVCEQKWRITFIVDKICDITKPYYLSMYAKNRLDKSLQLVEFKLDIVQSAVCGVVVRGLTLTAKIVFKTDHTFKVNLQTPILRTGETVYIETELISSMPISRSETLSYQIKNNLPSPNNWAFFVKSQNPLDINIEFKNAIRFTDQNKERILLHNSFMLKKKWFSAPEGGMSIMINSMLRVEYNDGKGHRRHLAIGLDDLEQNYLSNQAFNNAIDNIQNQYYIEDAYYSYDLRNMNDNDLRRFLQLDTSSKSVHSSQKLYIMPFVCNAPYTDYGVHPGSYVSLECDINQTGFNLVYCDEDGWNEDRAMSTCVSDTNGYLNAPNTRQKHLKKSNGDCETYKQCGDNMCCKSNEVCSKGVCEIIVQASHVDSSNNNNNGGAVDGSTNQQPKHPFTDKTIDFRHIIRLLIGSSIVILSFCFILLIKQYCCKNKRFCWCFRSSTSISDYDAVELDHGSLFVLGDE